MSKEKNLSQASVESGLTDERVLILKFGQGRIVRGKGTNSSLELIYTPFRFTYIPTPISTRLETPHSTIVQRPIYSAARKLGRQIWPTLKAVLQSPEVNIITCDHAETLGELPEIAIAQELRSRNIQVLGQYPVVGNGGAGTERAIILLNRKNPAY